MTNMKMTERDVERINATLAELWDSLPGNEEIKLARIFVAIAHAAGNDRDRVLRSFAHFVESACDLPAWVTILVDPGTEQIYKPAICFNRPCPSQPDDEADQEPVAH